MIALTHFPPAPSNGGALDATTPAKIGDWVWQPKIDDWRGVAHLPTRSVWNQYGQPSTVAHQGKIADALEEMTHRITIVTTTNPTSGFKLFDIGIMENRHDMMRNAIVVFDVMDTDMPHVARRQLLETMFPALPVASELLRNGNIRGGAFLINEWTPNGRHEGGGIDPLRLQALLKDQNAQVGRKFYEGLVAKRADALYPMGTRPKQKTDLWVKHRFDQ